MRRLIRTALVLAMLPVFALAQSPEYRFELGQKLRAFEKALEATTDAAKRTPALKALEPVTFTFFSGQIGEAGRLLDESRFLLRADPAIDAERWAASLKVEPAARLLDATAKEVEVTVGPFYKAKVAPPENPTVRLTLLDAAGKATATGTTPLPAIPGKAKLALTDTAAGDFTLRAEIVAGDKVLSTVEQAVSRAEKLTDRLAALAKAIDAAKEKDRTTDRLTLARLGDQLDLLAKGNTLETNYPSARLLKEAEECAAAVLAGKPYFGNKRPGEYWLVLATKAGNRVRVQAPDAVKAGKPVPVVFALHGAGGSENMFFDGYGDGLVGKLAAERGWLLVSPLVSGTPASAEVLDELNKLYPIDREKVFVLGHSMGAAATMAAVSREPKLFRAAAALGGGGQVKAGDDLKKVPVFVGIGERDFALTGAKSLNASLKKAEVATVEYKEYKGVEHLTIVQLSLRDVFGFFDKALAK